MFEDFGLSLKDSAGKSRKFKDLYNELMTKIRDSNGNIMPDALVKMNEMGIATTKSAGKMRPIIDVLRDIQKSTAKMSEEQKNAVLKALAGEEAYGKLNALLSTNMDTTQKWAEELKTTNVVNDAFAKYLETFTAQFTILKAKFEPVVKIIGGKFLENMSKVIKQITPLVDRIREWVKEHPKLTEQIVLFSTAVLTSLVGLGSFLVIIGSIGTKIGSLLGFLSSLVGGLGAIGSFLAANPIALWIAGIVTALGTLYLAWVQNWGNIQGIVNKFLQETGLDKWINGIVESFMHLYDNISPYITLIQEALRKIFSIAVGEGSLEEKMNKIKGVFAGLLKDFQPVIDGITGFVNKAVEEIMKLYYTIEPYILMIPDVFNKVWSDITTGFNNFVNEYKPAWDGLWEYALKLLTELWAELQPLITDIQAFVQEEWAKFNTETLPQLQVFFDAVIQEWNALKPIILPIVNLLMSGIMLAIKTYLSQIISDLKVLWSAFKVGWDIFTWVLNNLIIPGMTAIAMSITEIINNISESWKTVKELWKKYIAEPWDYFLKLIVSVTPTIVSAVAKLMESIWNSLKKYYLQMSTWFNSTFGEMLGTLQAIQQMASGGTSFNLTTSSGTTSASDTTSSSGSAKLSRSLSSASRSASSSASSGSKTFIVNGNIYGGDAGLRELNRLLRQYGFEEDARGVI